MAITTFGELKTAVANWMDRSDQTARIPEFVDMAVDRLNQALAAVDQEARAQRALTTEWSAVPTDFGGMRTMRDTDEDLPMEFFTPERFQQLVGEGYVPDVGMFTIEDMQFRVFPVPTVAAPVNVEMIYLQRLTPLSADADTNWVIEQAPSLMLAAVLVEAYGYLKDEQRAQYWDGRAGMMISELIASSRRRRYSGGPLAIQIEGVA